MAGEFFLAWSNKSRTRAAPTPTNISTNSEAEAEKNAQIIRGTGDKQAILIWNEAANKDPQFYAYYRTLEAYRNSMANGDTSMVLSPNSEFFEFFNKTMKNGK